MSEKPFESLLPELKKAWVECTAAKIKDLEVGNKHAPLCVELLVKGRQFPRLINNRIEKRKTETGLDPVHPDFWNTDMIIALYEHYKTSGALED